MNHRFDNFNQLVDAALNTERKRREIKDKKRKMAPAASGSNTDLSTSILSSSTRGRSSSTSSDSSSTHLVLSSSSRWDRAKGFQRLRHTQLHQLRGREYLLLLPGSRLQRSHECASTVASRDTTPTFAPGRNSLDSRDTQLSPRRHPRAG
jgi:hypothetical protein